MFKAEGIWNYTDTKIDYIKQQLNFHEYSNHGELLMLDENLIEDRFSNKIKQSLK